MAERYDDIVKKVLVSAEEIAEITKKLGEQISADYEGKQLVLVGMLKGAMPFMMDLTKNITLPLEMDFIQTSSYHGGTSSSTAVMFKKDIETNVVDKHVLLVDDVVDTAKAFNKSENVVDVAKTAETSRAARRESMRGANIPTSQQPMFQSKNEGIDMY